MKFGRVPVSEAAGAILAHSVTAGEVRLRKGVVLTASDVDALVEAGLASVIVARLEDGDVSEDEAAAQLGRALETSDCHLTPPVTGRVNLVADRAGVVEIDAARIDAANRVDEAITLATLPDMMAVRADQLVATVKVIPYGVAGTAVESAANALGESAIRLHPFRGGLARIVLTRTPGFKESLLAKGEEAVRARLTALGYEVSGVQVVAHEAGALAEALAEEADLTTILAASATSDRADVAPAAIAAAGGAVQRVGMPVDPGNLLVLGRLRGAPVVGLPGCARSPALNGADWVLERLAAGLDVTGDDVAGMGVGGLLKEMPERPSPRRRGRTG